MPRSAGGVAAAVVVGAVPVAPVAPPLPAHPLMRTQKMTKQLLPMPRRPTPRPKLRLLPNR